MRQFAIIGGTGLNTFPDADVIKTIECDTPYGPPSGKICLLNLSGNNIYFLARHGQPHCLPPHQINYRANIYALHQLGVTDVLAVNAVGGITNKASTGHICIPDQLIDYTWGRQHTYSQQDDSSGLLSVQHIDFTHPFSAPLRQALIEQGKTLELPLSTEGVYGVTQGPRLETAAEIRKYEQDGCDMVGMTAMPEAALSKELSINYASVCLSVNPAAGKSKQEITMEDILAVVNAGMEQVAALLSATISSETISSTTISSTTIPSENK